MHRILFVSFILFLIITSFSCNGVKTIYKYARHADSIEKQLPKSFKVEVPLSMHEGWFSTKGKINEKTMNFIFDTGAGMSLAKIEDLKALHTLYWGDYPIKSIDAHGKKSSTPLYYPDSLEIGSLSFQKPLFKAIYPNEYIHSFLPEIVIGEDLLSTCYWKFSMDDKKITLFAKQDNSLLEQEALGYYPINIGTEKKTELVFTAFQEKQKFILDLGFNGEISINKSMYTELSKSVSFKKYLKVYNDTLIDTLYLSEKTDLKWYGYNVEGCRLIYNPRSSYCFLGSKFMQRFNFILAFNDFKKKIYIKPSIAYKSSMNTACFSGFGFDIINDPFSRVHILESDGLAELAGLRLGDKVLNIDDGAFNLSADNLHDRLITYLANKKTIRINITRSGQMISIPISIVNK